MERIQKILAHGGISSRRAAEQLILAGRVRVNGKVVTELGAKANPRHDRVEVDGKRVVAEELVYIVLHKPRGVVATMHDPEGRPTVQELLKSIEGRLYPVGRLDFATSGVLLATNDGELADGLLHPRKAVPKSYVLKVKGVMKPDDLEKWRKGIQLEDGVTLPAQAKLLRHEADKTWFELTIKEGRNQQIRRMGEASGFPVMRLARVAFAEISAEGLAPGRWRHLTRDELSELKKTYGVPRSIPSPPDQGVLPTKRIQAKAVFVRGAVKGTAGRITRNAGAEAPTSARGFGRRPPPRENWGGDDAAVEPTERTEAPARGARGEAPPRGARGERPASRGDAPTRGARNERPASRGERPASRGDAPTRGARGDARGGGRGPSDRADRGAPARGPAPRGDRPDRGAPPRGDRPDRGAPPPRGDDRGARGAPSRSERPDRPARGAPSRGDRPDRGGPPRGAPPRGDRPDRGGAPPRGDRPDRGGPPRGPRAGGPRPGADRSKDSKRGR